MSESSASERQTTPSEPPSFTDGTLSNSMTDVFVGPDREKFVVHTDLITYWAPKISFHLRGKFFEEARLLVPSVLLPGVSPAVFRIFLDWMRSDGNQLPRWDMHKLEDTTSSESLEVEDNEIVWNRDAYHRSQPEAEALDCYIFAHEHHIRQFKNDLFDSILEMNPDDNFVPSYSIVIRAWEMLPPSSELRKYLIDLFARKWTHHTDPGHDEELVLCIQVPADFWYSILVARACLDELGGLDDYPPWEENLCQYHDHVKGEKDKCYWQYINDGKGYETDYTDDDEDNTMLDEYESDFIDDTGVVSDEEHEPELGSGNMQQANADMMKVDMELQPEAESTDSFVTYYRSSSLTL